MEILRLVATGVGNKEIAQKLYISSNTVKVHLRNIFNKIGVTSRTEAAMYAVRAGLVDNVVIQASEEDIDENNNVTAGQARNSIPYPDKSKRSARSKFRFWLPILFIAGLIGLIFLVWRLNPGFALTSMPTPTLLPIQNTSTPIPHWNNLSPLPIARSSLALVVYENQTYAIGGLDSQGVSGEVHRFDPQTNTWVSLSSKPSPVFDIRGAVVNGQIFIPGGRPNSQ